MKPAAIPEVCKRIEQLPNMLGITEYQLAKRIGKSQSVIQNIYKRGHYPGYEITAALCTEFNLDANWLLLGKTTHKRHTPKHKTA